MKHITEEDLVLLYYNEPGVAREAREHLQQCGECRASAQALARTLSVCSEWTVPETDPDFGRGVWARLAPRMTPAEEPRLARFRWFKVATALAVMATLLITAFIAGRASRQPRPSLTAGLSKQARERILAISLADHLDRAQMMLTEISNSSDSDTVEMSDERLRAQDLVEEGWLLRQTLARGGETSTLALLDEVERFMLELANSPEKLTPAAMRSLRERIGSGSLLFKVRIIESNLRNEGQKS